MLPNRNQIWNNKISSVVATCYLVQNEKTSKKKYVDSVRYDGYGFLVGKHITAFDTTTQRIYAGDWSYTYDSVGNRKLETRACPGNNYMDYFNYVYDSGRIKKQIWVYWINLKHIFDRIYEVKYDGNGRLAIEKVEDGSETLDSIFSFNYDSTNRMNKIICGKDREFKDTINVVDYFYNPDGSVAKTVTRSKGAPSVEEFTYDQNRRTVKDIKDDVTTTYEYDKNGLLTTSEVVDKGKKGMKHKYTYAYIYR